MALSWLTSHCLVLVLSWVGIRLWLHLADPDGSLCAVAPLVSLCGDSSTVLPGQLSPAGQVGVVGVGFALSPKCLKWMRMPCVLTWQAVRGPLPELG